MYFWIVVAALIAGLAIGVVEYFMSHHITHYHESSKLLLEMA